MIWNVEIESITTTLLDRRMGRDRLDPVAGVPGGPVLTYEETLAWSLTCRRAA